MDALLYFSLKDYPCVLYTFSVLTTLLSFCGWAMMLKFYFFFRESKEFELALVISKYYFWASFIYFTTGLFGIGGLFTYTTSIDDIAFMARPFVLVAVLVAAWRLFWHFKHTHKNAPETLRKG